MGWIGPYRSGGNQPTEAKIDAALADLPDPSTKAQFKAKLLQAGIYHVHHHLNAPKITTEPDVLSGRYIEGTVITFRATSDDPVAVLAIVGANSGEVTLDPETGVGHYTVPAFNARDRRRTWAITATTAAGDIGRESVEIAILEDIPQNYTLVWEDKFSSLSLRTGGPTWGGYANAGSKGTWTPAGIYWRDGGDGGGTMAAAGSVGFGHDWFVDPEYDWQSIDPSFPPLGMLDITEQGLHLKTSTGYPAIRAALPPWQKESIGSNILPDGPANGAYWYNNNGATSADQQNPGIEGLGWATTITTAGNSEARRESGSFSVTAGETYRVAVKYALGTSGKLYGFVNFGAGAGTVFVGEGTWENGNALNKAVTEDGGYRTLEFEVTATTTGTGYIGFGPGSKVNGETVILYDVAVVAGKLPRLDRYLSSLVSTLYSAKMAPPFYRETDVLIPGGPDDFPAVWGLGDKSFADQYAESFEVDELERFGNAYADSIAHSAVHISRARGPNYNLLDASSTLDTGKALPGRWVTIGAWVTKDAVTTYIDGQQIARFDVPKGANTDDLMHSILNVSAGVHGRPYPPNYNDAEMIVRGVRFYAPSSSSRGVFPPAPPVPAVKWEWDFAAETPAGTAVATLSGAASYSVLGTEMFEVRGSQLMTTAKLAPGNQRFYLRGLDANGVPGIAPALEITISTTRGSMDPILHPAQ